MKIEPAQRPILLFIYFFNHLVWFFDPVGRLGPPDSPAREPSGYNSFATIVNFKFTIALFPQSMLV